MRIGLSRYSMSVLMALTVVASACSGSSSVSLTTRTSVSEPPPTTTTEAPSPSDTSVSTSTVTREGESIAACDLLSPEDVAGAIGESTSDPVFDDSVEGFFTCSYEGTTGDMTVDIVVYPDVEMAKGGFRRHRHGWQRAYRGTGR